MAYRTLLDWWTHWEQYGETPSETAKRHKKENLRFRKRHANSKVTPSMGVYLQELVTEKPWLYLDELQEALFIQGRSLIGKLLHHLAFSHQPAEMESHSGYRSCRSARRIKSNDTTIEGHCFNSTTLQCLFSWMRAARVETRLVDVEPGAHGALILRSMKFSTKRGTCTP